MRALHGRAPCEFVGADDIRTRFSTALSAMYAIEVPLYADLLDLVTGTNARVAGSAAGSEPRLEIERHGAIRLGRPDELAQIGRLFAVMGMHPVGYYDLAPAGVPVHSTAFRPLTGEALARNPFRMFTSLLRLELIEDAALREEAAHILATRSILAPRAQALVAQAEREGGLRDEDATALVAAALQTFRWNARARVDRATYERLRAAHPLIADVVCFAGPHVNHLTPRTLDIDAVHAAMRARAMNPKETIEGPPPRAVPVLLRQTSFRAREEPILFGDEPGTHTARFGEVEQRGAALTPKGRTLYDQCLASGDFTALPDDVDSLRDAGLIFCRRHRALGGATVVEPITYEDFLPVSAAGIFRSNLDAGGAARVATSPGRRADLEAALHAPLADEMALYAAQADG